MNTEKMVSFVTAKYQAGRLNASKAGADFHRKHPVSSGKRIVRRVSWAIPVAAALIVGVFLFNNRRNAWTEYGPEDQRSIAVLADGTSITLAPGAILRVQNRVDPRKVNLSGLACFDVSHDESHPFEIIMDGAYVRVLGTQFSLDADKKEVSVESGRVLFAADGVSQGVILTSGMRASIEDGQPVLSDYACLNPAAWVSGKFVYDGARLENVLCELGAYFGESLSVDGGIPDGARLTGTFSAGSLDDILDAISDALDISIIAD